MSYTHDRVIEDASIDDADARLRTALAARGFCVLTEIDIKATLKAKIGVEVDNYRILGACSPFMVYIQVEPRVGAMLP